MTKKIFLKANQQILLLNILQAMPVCLRIRHTDRRLLSEIISTKQPLPTFESIL